MLSQSCGMRDTTQDTPLLRDISNAASMREIYGVEF